jgi:ketosteroid isomerase-like protein
MKLAAQKMLYFTLAMMAGVSALADEFADVSKLAKAGKVVEALNKTNEYLSKHPADAQMRFMKGVLLTEQNKSDEAIAVFTKLTEDYKDLPEPYNNLAVLYAAQGQYDKARVALEKAIRTNPSYQTAYENLGDIYGKMASQAYDKALALGTPPAPPKSNLALLRNFSASTGSKIVAVQAPVPAPPIPTPVPAPAPKVAAAAVTLPAAAKPLPAAAVVPLPAPAPAPIKVAAAPVVAPKPAPAPPPAPAPAPKPDTAERDAVMAQVNGWAKAWATQNVDSYLGYYSAQFEPPKGMTRKAWADERRARIEGKGRIRVEVASPEVSVNGNTARVTFRQTYESDRLTARSRKTLMLVKNGDKWQIKQEVSN